MIGTYDHAQKLFVQAGLDVSRETFVEFERYIDMLLKKNKQINLTRITDSEEILQKHLLDSALLLKYYDFPKGANILDVGSGAGFPGIPLKLMRKDLCITLNEPMNKRIDFLDKVADALDLDLWLCQERAEIMGRNPHYREHFDIVTARAVANFSVLAEYCLPLVKKGGVWLAMKTPNEKINEGVITLLGGELVDVYKYKLPNGNNRVLYEVKKVKNTQGIFPRFTKHIKGNPLN